MRATLETMGALQIDAINTVIRSHYMPLFSRLGHYDRSDLDRLALDLNPARRRSPTSFEYWGHECSILPIETYPLFRWRMQDALEGRGLYRSLHRFAEQQPDAVARVLAQITEHGGSTTREFGGGRNGPGMWEWSDAKLALEYLFATGRLACAGRRQFQRVYELPERVIPGEYLDQRVERSDAMQALVLRAVRALGVATESDIRDYYRLPVADIHSALETLARGFRVQPVRVEGWSKLGWISDGATIPRQVADLSTFLSPFDPLVWCRDRAARLFGFHYRIEIYVPREKRQYGYYVMPFLSRDRLLGRADLQADRDCGVLNVKGLWWEQGIDQRQAESELDASLERLALWLGLDDVNRLTGST